MVFAQLFKYIFLYGFVVGIIMIILLEIFIFGIIYIIKTRRKHIMYEVILLNEKGEKFTKQFYSEFLFNKFLNKARRSKKLTVIGYGKISW